MTQKRDTRAAATLDKGRSSDRRAPSTPLHAEILYLQATAGNRAVTELLRETVQRAPTTPSGPAVTITFGSRAKPAAVNAASLAILTDVLTAAGLSSAEITSTARSPADQARAMYQNLVGRGKGQGVRAQHNLYGPGGDKVIDEFVALRAQRKSATAIKNAMRDKIVAVGPTRVSRHCGDPAVLNVIDVGPRSIGAKANQDAFVAAAQAEEGKRVRRFIPYPRDPGHHFEIPPP